MDKIRELAEKLCNNRPVYYADAERILREGLKPLLARIDQLERLLVCYRLQTKPSEQLLYSLKKSAAELQGWRKAQEEMAELPISPPGGRKR